MVRTLGQINAMANITDQTNKQRNEFGRTFGGEDTVNKLTKGVAGDLTGIFPLLDANQINDNAYIQAKSTLVITDGTFDHTIAVNVSSYNPDFKDLNISLNFKDSPTYTELTAESGSITQAKDKPSLIGPNLKSIGFDANGAPDITGVDRNINRNSQTADNRHAIGTQGFGRFYSNVNNLGPRFANYLSNKFDDDENNNPVLGQSKHGTYQ